MDYFIINQEKIYIDYKEDKLIFSKYVNDELIELSEEEKNELLNSLKLDDKYMYDSQRLIELMNSNPLLSDSFKLTPNFVVSFDYCYDLLSYVEQIIPEKYRSIFYNNIKTLKIELKEKIHLKKEVADNAFAYYNREDNTIVIIKERIDEFIESVKLIDDYEKWVYAKVTVTLLHELFHAASSNVDVAGFDSNSNPGLVIKGLTEGMTDRLAYLTASFIGIKPEMMLPNGYFIELLIVDQLMLIIGPQPMIDSYFGNLGVEPLCDKLSEIDDFNAKYLFTLIELEYSLRMKGNNDERTTLGSIQEKLVDYFSKVILKDIENGLEEETIREKIIFYKGSLITKELLSKMQLNPDNYINLNISLEKFENFESELNKFFKTRTRRTNAILRKHFKLDKISIWKLKSSLKKHL